jgi:hypothetical protein
MRTEKSNVRGAKSNGIDTMNDLRLEAARRRLAESCDHEDAIEGLREIVANFLGSEEFGLFTVDRTRGVFRAAWSFGIELDHYDLMLALGDTGVQRVMRGEYHLEAARRDGHAHSTRVKAFIPIRHAGQTIAILAILRLLPQKIAFDRSDHDLFKLLSEEAGKPLFGANPQSKSAAEGPRATV